MGVLIGGLRGKLLSSTLSHVSPVLRGGHLSKSSLSYSM